MLTTMETFSSKDSDYGTSICTSDEECCRAGAVPIPKTSSRFWTSSAMALSRRSLSSVESGAGSLSDDDLDGLTIEPGTCPHCRLTFAKPVSLQCGHSLCSLCCNTLLAALRPLPPRRNRIRMGISSLSYSHLPSSSTASTSTLFSNMNVPVPRTISYRTPACPVCGEPPKMTSPVPNIELEKFIDRMQKRKFSEYRNPMFREEKPTTFGGVKDICRFNRNNSTRFNSSNEGIRECLIAVLGARGVGKTSITRVQYGNEMLFGGSDSEDELDSTVAIDILDDNNVDTNLERAHGVVLVYSITDRNSLDAAAIIARRVHEIRGKYIPIIVVGSKNDVERKRSVAAFEGQDLARSLSAPFRELSARRNDGVNEAFVELLRVIEKRRGFY